MNCTPQKIEYNGYMLKFLIGLVVVLAAVVGGYYYVFMADAEVQEAQEQRGAAANVQVNTNRIPAGAVMEDGTLPE